MTENPHVKQGLSWDNLKWAFHPEKSSEFGYWQPVTWLSHMADCQLFGVRADMHHLANLCFHLLNIFLLFFLLNYMTKSPWKSLFVAALFALHPINVDSVAWIAERKNLLSTAFGLMAMIGYAGYAKRPSLLRYTLIVIPFAVSLMAKSMLVTLPCVLLLLDYWPLRRFRWAGLQSSRLQNSNPKPFNSVPFIQAPVHRLILEKLPLLALSLAAIAFSVFSLQIQERMVDETSTPFPLRISNALVSCLVYLKKLIWPNDLAIFYPFPETIPLWKPVSAAFILLLISAAIAWRAKKSPYLVTGWLWFLGTLVPVSGLVQNGLWPALADRWAYVPLVGIFIIAAWGVPEIFQRLKLKKPTIALTAAAFIPLFFFSYQTAAQLTQWKNDGTVFKHALSVTENNYIAHNGLGLYYYRVKEDPEKASYHFRKSLEINQHHLETIRNYATLLTKEGNYEKARRLFNKALMHNPKDNKAYRGLGDLHMKLNNWDKAADYYSRAIRMAPLNPKPHNEMGNLLLEQGRLPAASKKYQSAIDLQPENPIFHYNLGIAKTRMGKLSQALNHFKTAIKYDSNYLQPYLKTAEIFFQKGDLESSERYYRAALQIAPDNETIYYSLGVVLLQMNRVDEAVKLIEKALKINPEYKKAANALSYIKKQTAGQTKGSVDFD
ncbi:MAG: tetratricopeptide repeat protein [Desulfobacterales bacterium]|nr:tetratricopeptide repeat protein [Desulfobacterales bacterium]